ncbi:MAG: orotidine-5'-phosphate decarboxylase [Saprospiraceae bacterium]|nr:orotidine-5'-phosphate decarboxylase [Saprospiraceae bacterium]
MTRDELFENIRTKKSFLCVGLDTDIQKIPAFLLDTEDPVFEFNKIIIDATKDYCIAYKPNLAFYESLGSKGWQSLEKTMGYIPENIFTIADAKRGDIGNTGKLYARTFFEHFNFDAVTVAPYMGEDSIIPFLEYPYKWVILLGLTSNKGSQDFQQLNTSEGKLYEYVIKKSQQWGNPDNLMFVVGATHPDKIAEIRALAKDYFFLVPGVGAQGGDLDAVVKSGRNSQMGLLVNSSREIIYADSSPEFATHVTNKAKVISAEMAKYFK